MRHKFTKGWIEGLSVEVRTRYTDINNPSLSIRVTPTGSKTFYYRARHKHRGVVERKIGPFPQWTIDQARAKATEMAASFNAGIDPEAAQKEEAKKKQQDALTLNQAISDWLADFQQMVEDGERRPRTLETYTDIYENHLQKSIGKLSLIEITDEILQEFIKEKRPAATLHNHIRVVISSAYKHASKKHRIKFQNPTSSVKLRQIRKRDRFLQPGESARLFAAIEEEQQLYQDLVRVILYTGQRKGVVYTMEWVELNLQRCTWTIPGRKMKGKKAHTVPLIPQVVEILQRRRREVEGRYVFPWKNGPHVPLNNYYYWSRIVKRAGLDHNEEGQERLTIHDLRRTLASWQAAEGVGLQQISQTLAHQDINLTASTYAHINAESTRAGIQAAVAAINRAAAGTPEPAEQADPIGALLDKLSVEEKAALLARLKGD
ncbi:tyrosine-type recombinase/integrase [Marinobacterium sp. MBR-109]|jgi:integrase|uniref:tyrosine-type recombinase/integrase n=1 Tax=Marinobacterium sp. MBR-109 TaxID=3156462 RepID=UPI003396B63C